MDDPENGGSSERPRRSTKGVPIYAIESLVVSVLEFGWLAIPSATGASITADRVLLLPLAVAGVLNVLMCSLTADNRTALGAFASLSITCTFAYLLVFLEAMSVEEYAEVYFDNNTLLQFMGAITLALMALHSLLALAAVHDRIWAQTAWIEGTLFLSPCLLAAICLQTSQRTYGLVTLGLGLFFWLFTGVMALVNDHLRLLFVLTRLAALATAFTGSVVAILTGLTDWAYPILNGFILFLFVCRSITDWRQIRQANAAGAQLQQVVPSAPPLPQAVENPPQSPHAPHSMGHRVAHSHFPYTALRATHQNAEAVLFSGHGRYLRQQSKKLI